ncbi:hypothetical protein ES703_98967 [subsurface metagenome]
MQNPYKDFSNVNPQREDGRREIETSVFQALIHAGLSGLEYALVLLVLDKTWGWNKTEDMIPLVQFVEATGQDRSYVVRGLKSLEKRHIIIVQHVPGGGRGRGNIYMFNKYWDIWITGSLKETVTNSHPLETVTEPEPSGVKSDQESPFRETVAVGHPLGLKSDPESPIINSDQESPFRAGNSDYLSGKGDKHARGKSDSQSPSIEIQKKPSIENRRILKKEKKVYHGNVHLYPEEYDKLVEKFGKEDAEDRIGALSLYIKSMGAERKYKDHYATILNWERMNKVKEKSSAEKKEKGGRYAGRDQPPGRGAGAHRGDTKEGGKFSGFRAIKSGSEQPDDREED